MLDDTFENNENHATDMITRVLVLFHNASDKTHGIAFQLWQLVAILEVYCTCSSRQLPTHWTMRCFAHERNMLLSLQAYKCWNTKTQPKQIKVLGFLSCCLQLPCTEFKHGTCSCTLDSKILCKWQSSCAVFPVEEYVWAAFGELNEFCKIQRLEVTFLSVATWCSSGTNGRSSYFHETCQMMPNVFSLIVITAFSTARHAHIVYTAVQLQMTFGDFSDVEHGRL